MYGIQASQRSLYLSNFTQELIKAFPYLAHYQGNAIGATGGFPPSQARGRKVRPAYLHSKMQGWHGTGAEEDGMLYVHPAWLNSAERIGKALLYGLSKASSSRWGLDRVGIEWDGQELKCNAHSQQVLAGIIENVGEPPEGFADLFPVRNVQRARLRKWVCPGDDCKLIVRIASDVAGEELKHSTCGNTLVLA